MSGEIQVDTKTERRMKSFREIPFDGAVLKRMIEASLTWLRANQGLVNSLNVFPVPDGDTGTNMVLTMQAAYDEIAELPERNFGKMAHAVANGALMGARGNSGVILSQLWRGFARGVANQEVLDVPTLVHAFGQARDTAYRGVVRPVEGTILTVAKDVAAEAERSISDTQDPLAILERVVAAADTSVQHTPELLPVLKEAGVVDAGGMGFYLILDGMLRYATGQPLEQTLAPVQPLEAMKFDNTMELIEPGQDYEVVVDFQPESTLDLPSFYKQLEELGTSIQVGEGDGIYRMHIHVPTENRYKPIDYVMSLGKITKVAMENLMEQVSANQNARQGEALKLAQVEAGQIAVISVSPGKGISRVFASLGAAGIVEGGQTMNPSTQEILAAFENLPTDKIIILPNNKNIILTAKSAAEVTVKKVAVIPSKSVPQGLAAMMRLAPDGEMKQVVDEMTSALDDIQTGEITTATRNAAINGVNTKEGEIISLHNGTLVQASKDLKKALLGFLKKVHAEDYELITLFYGADLSQQEANKLADAVRKSYPNQEVEIQEGGQPHYFFIIAVE